MSKTQQTQDFSRKIVKVCKDGSRIALCKIDVEQNSVTKTTTLYVEYLSSTGKKYRYPLKLNFNLTQDELMYLVFEGDEKTL